MRTSPTDLLRLLRLQAAGFQGFIFLMGPMLAGVSISIRQGVALWSIGVLLNGYIFALNDLVDLPFDRLNPVRRLSALVSGRVSERLALALSVALPLSSAILVALADWNPGPTVAFLVVLILAAFVNIYQKVTRRPLAMDLLFSVTMAAPLPVATWAIVGAVPAEVWMGSWVLFLLALELNSLAGNLKDLESDTRVGFRTVAISKGARLTEDGHLASGKRYRRYALALHIGATISAVTLVMSAAGDLGRRAQLVIALLSLLVAILGTRDLIRMLRGRRRPSSTGREVYFASGFALLTLAAAILAPPPLFMAAVAALAGWELAFRTAFGKSRHSRAADG